MTEWSLNDSLAGLSVAWLSICAVLWVAGTRMEEAVSPRAREHFSAWIQGIDAKAVISRMSDSLTHTFDSVFGSRHLSWACFRRSAIASLLSVAFVILISGLLDDRHFGLWYRLLSGAGFSPEDLFLASLPLTLNLLPDYLSLLETRWIVGRLGQARSRCAVAGLMAADALATYLVAFSAVFLATWGYNVHEGVSPDPARLAAEVGRVIAGVFDGAAGETFYRPFVLSTFLTSAWVYLHVASGLLFRASEPADSALRFVRYLLDVEQKPFLSVSLVAMAVVTVASAVVATLRVALWQH